MSLFRVSTYFTSVVPRDIMGESVKQERSGEAMEDFLKTRTLKDIRTISQVLANSPGVTRRVGAIGIALIELIEDRHRTGGVEMIRDGVSSYAFTCGQSEDVCVQLGMWLIGAWDTKPSWPGYPQLVTRDYQRLSEIAGALDATVDWVWESRIYV